MLDDHFAEELQRVVDVFDELPLSHVKELKRAYMRIDRRLWVQMVSHVIDNSQYIPRPSKFRTAYEVYRLNWKTEAEVETIGCAECERGFQELYVVCNGLAYKSLRPCVCNPIKLNLAGRHTPIEKYITKEAYEAMVVQRQAQNPVRERPAPRPVQVETEPPAEPKPGPHPIADSMPQLPEDLTW